LFGKYKGMSPSSAILEINLVYLTEFEVLLYIKKKEKKERQKCQESHNQFLSNLQVIRLMLQNKILQNREFRGVAPYTQKRNCVHIKKNQLKTKYAGFFYEITL
jgi:hypothetical protein